MKKDTSNTVIDLDALFATSKPIEVQPLTESVTTPSFSNTPDLDSILTEWAWRCDKGYPDFNNLEDRIKLQEVLDEMGINPPFQRIEEVGKELPKPVVSTNETAVKEGLVCLFFDCFKDASLKKSILDLQSKKISGASKKEDITKLPEFAQTVREVAQVFKQNKGNYGTGKSAVANLDQYVKWVWATGQELDTLNNSISAANTIHASVVKKGTIIRNETFDSIRALAVKLIKQDYDITMFPDNWCPGDVYVIATPGADNKALQAKSLNTDPKSNLNSNFAKNSKIVAISLKEERAQAGKASTFADTVFTKDYKANVDKTQLYGTSNKDVVKVTASVTRYLEYRDGGTKRKQSYINAITKQGKIHSSVNAILKAAEMPVTYTTSNITKSTNEADFYKKNKKIFQDLDAAVQRLQGRLQSEKQVKDSIKTFVNSRNKFINQLQGLKISVESPKSATFAKEIQDTAGDDAVKTFSMKTATYELASLIMNKWITDIEKISPAYKKIAEVSNPFVALTAFAIAEAGINPSFWKVIGSARGLNGQAHYFDSNDVVDIDTKMSPIKLIDSAGQAGFYLQYVTVVGSKRYNTRLVFRFANDTIRIEVERLTAIS